MYRRLSRGAAALALILAIAGVTVLVRPTPVLANPVPAPVGGPPGGPATNAQITLGPTSADVGSTIRGFLGPAAFDPVASGYPPAVPNPPAGFTPADAGANLFAGTIAGTTQAGLLLSFYCVDLSTDTFAGLGYNASTWAVQQIPNIALIHRLLNGFFPQTNQPAALATPALKAAAVQAAIWFLSDKFVVNTSTPTGALIYPIVSGIVASTIAAGPLGEPPTPTLIVDGPTTGAAGAILGPYTVRASAVNATLTVTGAQVFADAAGTVPLPSPTTIAVGTPFFIRTADPASVTISATADVPALFGNVAGYIAADPDNPLPIRAQKLILSQTTAVSLTASLTVTTSPAPAPSPTLPVTGSSTVGPLGLGGAAMVTLGLGLVLAAWSARWMYRGRRRADESATSPL